jgi:hypothetical protein
MKTGLPLPALPRRRAAHRAAHCRPDPAHDAARKGRPDAAAGCAAGRGRPDPRLSRRVHPAHLAGGHDPGGAARPADPLQIPLLTADDCIHGHSFWPGATIFPTQLAMACTWDPALIQQVGRVTAREVAATGLHWTFRPCCASRVTCAGAAWAKPSAKTRNSSATWAWPWFRATRAMAWPTHGHPGLRQAFRRLLRNARRA